MSISIYLSAAGGKPMRQRVPESWLAKPVRKLAEHCATLLLASSKPDVERLELWFNGMPLELSSTIGDSLKDGATYTLEEKPAMSEEKSSAPPLVSLTEKGPQMAACECCVLKASVSWKEAVADISPAASAADLLAAASFLATISFPHVRRTPNFRTVPLAIRRLASRACRAVVELVDVRRRFCSPSGELPRALLLARDAQGRLVGTAGLEPAVWSRTQQLILPSHEAESRVKRSVEGAGSWSLPEGFELSAMLTRVAVEPALRRSGLAQELCTRLDGLAAEWAFGPPHSVLMQVGQSNEAARWLAAKMGFREGFRGPSAPKEEGVDVTDDAPTIIVTLGKRIGPVAWRLVAPVPPFD